MKVAVGGMISSGKSTLVKRLSDYLGIPEMKEFDEDDGVFHTLLSWLYEGKEDTEMLLQVYFLHKHWKAQAEFGTNVVVDRHIIEHWLFAQQNLQATPEVLNMYNGLFHAYMNSTFKPDLYIILDMDWENFVQRIMKRSRPEELDNFDSNAEYFKGLMEKYTDLLEAQCKIYDINYVVVDTNGLSNDEVFEKAKDIIEEYRR